MDGVGVGVGVDLELECFGRLWRSLVKWVFPRINRFFPLEIKRPLNYMVFIFTICKSIKEIVDVAL